MATRRSAKASPALEPDAADAAGVEPSLESNTRPEKFTKRAQRELRRIVLHFTPSWFSVNMGTGITSILLHELPYQFKGLHDIANVVFGLNVVLFILFLITTVARYVIWPNLLPIMLFHPTQSMFLGTLSMGFTTIVNMCAISAAPNWGPGFVIFTWVLWWINTVLALAICICVPFVQFTRQTHSWDKLTGVWFLPVVSTIVQAASSGIVAGILPEAHARLTIIMGYILWGTGFPLAVLLMALYYGRLAIFKIPPAALIVSAFLPLGPCGQGAFGLMKLSVTLKQLTQETGVALGGNSTPAEAQIVATAIHGCTIPIALIIWGLGLIWLAFAVMFLVDLAIVQNLSFNLGWWGFTFPLGVFATATTQFAKELDSGFFKVLGTVLSLVEVALWLAVAMKTFMGAITGKLFFSPCLAEEGGEPPANVPQGRKYEYTPRD